MLTSSQQTRLLSTGRNATAAGITAGRYTWATLAEVLVMTAAAAKDLLISMGQDVPGGTRRRGLELVAMLNADNVTGTIRVWQFKYCRGKAAFELAYLGSLAVTAGNITGAATDDAVKSTEYIADTMVWTPGTAVSTPKGISGVVETIYQSSAAAAYSPANDTPARFFMPEAGNGDILLEPYVGSASNSLNAVYEVNS